MLAIEDVDDLGAVDMTGEEMGRMFRALPITEVDDDVPTIQTMQELLQYLQLDHYYPLLVHHNLTDPNLWLHYESMDLDASPFDLLYALLNSGHVDLIYDRLKRQYITTESDDEEEEEEEEEEENVRAMEH